MQGARIGLIAVLMTGLLAGPVFAQSRADLMVTKLGRGAVNTVTGWVEIPKQIHQEREASTWGRALTWGLLKGLGWGAVRTLGGLYEVVTFPFPAPPDYTPLMDPVYVFSASSTPADRY